MTNTATRNAIARDLGDFTITWRVVPICVLAIVIGLFSTGIALVVLKLIALFTNLFFFQAMEYGADLSRGQSSRPV